jgi:predicted metal-dependent hydrolase
MAIDLSFLDTYPEKIQTKIHTLIEEEGLEEYIRELYPENHKIITDKELFEYVQDLRKKYMKKAPPAHKVVFDDSNSTVYYPLGLKDNELILNDNGHKIKNVMRIASLYKNAPLELFHMVVAHELAHTKEREHENNFFRLCHHLDGDYSQHEFDLRLFLISQGF